MTPSLNELQLISALSNVFEKFDISGDGTISIEEYKILCEEYGVPLSEEDIMAIRAIADEYGEVTSASDDCVVCDDCDLV